MDQPIRPKASNAHKPRIRIVERRETVYETKQPIFAKDQSGEPVATGHFRQGSTYARLGAAMEFAPNGTAATIAHVRRTGLQR